VDVYKYLLLFETLGMNAVADQLLDDLNHVVVLPTELIKGFNS
jgi:hypothetical protein